MPSFEPSHTLTIFLCMETKAIFCDIYVSMHAHKGFF